MRRLHLFVILAALMAVLLAACGDDDAKPASTAQPASTAASAAPSASPTPSASASAAPSASADELDALLGGAGGAPDTPAAVSGSAPPPQPPPSEPAPQAKVDPKPAPAPAPAPAPQPEPQPETQPEPAPAPPVAPAKKGSADEVAEKVDAIYRPIKNFRARFKQQYIAKVAGTTKNSEGVVYVRRPNKLSFRYHDPNKNRVVSDGTTLKIYEHDNKQMFVKPVAGTEYPGAFAFIMGKGLRENFQFEFHNTAQWEGGPVLIGRPRSPNPGYKVVLFYIDDSLLEKGDPRAIRRVLVLDAQGNRNRFDFVHIEQPESIGDAEFQFTPPKGTNIIK